MIKSIALTGVISSLVLSMIIWLLDNPYVARDCFIGGMLSTSNLMLIYWALKRIFIEKSVAFAGAVIVFKYAIILGLFVVAIRHDWRINYGFVVGLTTLFPTILVVARKHINKERAK